jgi:hypothetical protein
VGAPAAPRPDKKSLLVCVKQVIVITPLSSSC